MPTKSRRGRKKRNGKEYKKFVHSFSVDRQQLRHYIFYSSIQGKDILSVFGSKKAAILRKKTGQTVKAITDTTKFALKNTMGIETKNLETYRVPKFNQNKKIWSYSVKCGHHFGDDEKGSISITLDGICKKSSEYVNFRFQTQCPHCGES